MKKIGLSFSEASAISTSLCFRIVNLEKDVKYHEDKIDGEDALLLYKKLLEDTKSAQKKIDDYLSHYHDI